MWWKSCSGAAAEWTNRVVCFAGLLILQSTGSAANLSLFPVLATLSYFPGTQSQKLCSSLPDWILSLSLLVPSIHLAQEEVRDSWHLLVHTVFVVLKWHVLSHPSSFLYLPHPLLREVTQISKWIAAYSPQSLSLSLSVSSCMFLFFHPLSLSPSFSRPPPSKNRINLGKRIPPLYLVLLLTLPLG